MQPLVSLRTVSRPVHRPRSPPACRPQQPRLYTMSPASSSLLSESESESHFSTRAPCSRRPAPCPAVDELPSLSALAWPPSCERSLGLPPYLGLDLAVDAPVALGRRRAQTGAAQAPCSRCAREDGGAGRRCLPYCDHHAAGAICLAFSTTDSLVKTPSRSRYLDSSSSQASHPLNNLGALGRDRVSSSGDVWDEYICVCIAPCLVFRIQLIRLRIQPRSKYTY